MRSAKAPKTRAMDLRESAATRLSVFDKAKATGVPVLIVKDGQAMAIVKPFKTISGIAPRREQGGR